MFLDDNQFTNLLVRIILVLEPKEQVAIEILVIVIVVITVPEMSIPVWFAVFCEPYVYTSKKMIHENLRFINIPDVPKKSSATVLPLAFTFSSSIQCNE
jgi:hypothetical protein